MNIFSIKNLSIFILIGAGLTIPNQAKSVALNALAGQTIEGEMWWGTTNFLTSSGPNLFTSGGPVTIGAGVEFTTGAEIVPSDGSVTITTTADFTPISDTLTTLTITQTASGVLTSGIYNWQSFNFDNLISAASVTNFVNIEGSNVIAHSQGHPFTATHDDGDFTGGNAFTTAETLTVESTYSITSIPIPEPATYLMLGSMIALVTHAKNRKKSISNGCKNLST